MNNQFNDIEQLYKREIEYSFIKEKYICPVCQKGFQSKTSAENHKNQRNCFNAVSLFRNTEHEQKMYDIYLELMENQLYVSKFHIINKDKFRKEPIYKDLAKFVFFCEENGIVSMTGFLFFIYYSNNTWSIKGTLTKGQTNKWVRKFRYYLQQNPELIECETFVRVNQQTFLNNPVTLIRSLERADITPHIAKKYINFEQLQLTQEQEKRLNKALQNFKYL